MTSVRQRAPRIAHGALFLILCACGSGGGTLPPPPHVTILSTSLPPAVTGVALETRIEVEAPTEPVRVHIAEGMLPPGLVLDPFTQMLTGMPTRAGTFPFTLQASAPARTDGRYEAPFLVAQHEYEFVVEHGPLRFITTSVPDAMVNEPYFFQLRAIGGDERYGFTAGLGLPEGLELSTGGTLHGVPITNVDAPYNFSVEVTDGSGASALRAYVMDVGVIPLTIKTTELPPGTAGYPYRATMLLGSPGSNAGIAWSQAPPGDGETELASIGLRMRPDGVLEDTGEGPTEVGTFRFTLRVEDSVRQRDERTFDLVVAQGPVLYGVAPHRAIDTGPFTVTGAGFDSGTTLTFGAGSAGSVEIEPTFVDSSTLRFSTPPSAPGLSGPVNVRVTDSAGRTDDLEKGFIFPAKVLSFSPTTILPEPESSLSSTGVDAADVDGDGLADIVHCGSNAPGWSNAAGLSGGIHLLINRPAGASFDPSDPKFELVVLEGTGDWHQVKFADMNLDGFPDIVAVGGEPLGVRVYLNERTAAEPHRAPFSTPVSPVTSPLPYLSTAAVHVSDMKLGLLTRGDTVPDLAYVHQDASEVSVDGTRAHEAGGSVTVLRGSTDGTFAELETKSAIGDFFSAASVAVGHFGTDAQEDVAIGDQCVNRLYFDLWAGLPSYGGDLGMLGYTAETNGDGTMGEFTTWLRVPGGSGVLFVEVLGMDAGRITGRALDDIIMVHGYDSDFGRFGGEPGLVLFGNNGTGTSWEANPVASGDTVYRYVTLLDADLDGDDDVAVTGGRRYLDGSTPTSTFNALHVYRSAGTANSLTRVESITVAAGSPADPSLHNVGRIAAADFNGDGFPDVVLCLSFFAQAREDGTVQRNRGDLPGSGEARSPHTDRGPGRPTGVAIFLNDSR